MWYYKFDTFDRVWEVFTKEDGYITWFYTENQALNYVNMRNGVRSLMDKHYTIISKDNCIWCTKAKALLEQKGLIYQEFNIDVVVKDHWACEVLKRGGFKTVPQVYDGPDHIGGYADLEKYLND